MGKENFELLDHIGEAEWERVEPHLKRDAVFVVDQELRLEKVGAAVANDEAERVAGWLAEGLLSRPTEAQLEAWGGKPKKLFKTLIVQPFVLIQLPLPQ